MYFELVPFVRNFSPFASSHYRGLVLVGIGQHALPTTIPPKLRHAILFENQGLHGDGPKL
jgi:hypothetical protein